MEAPDRLERLTNLVLVLLDTPRPLTLRHLATVVSGYPEGDQARRQAFERDKRTLREEGVPISVEPVDDVAQVGYRIRPEDYYLPELSLTPDEQVALNLAVAGVHLDDASGRDALAKLGFLRLDPSVRVATLPSLPALALLHEALQNRSSVSFSYRSRRREVNPYGLLFRGGSWYLAGWDREREALRTYRVDRMEDLPQPTDEGGSYELPPDFDPSESFPAEPWRIGEADEIEAVVVVDEVLGPAVVEELGEDAVIARDGSGSVSVRLEVTNPEAFRSWLLGLLDHAEVTSPESLREEVVSWLAAMVGERAQA